LDYEVAAAKYQGKQAKQPWLTLLTTVRQKLLVSYSKVVISSIFEFKNARS